MTARKKKTNHSVLPEYSIRGSTYQMFVILRLQIQNSVSRKTGNEGRQFHQQDFPRITLVPWASGRASEYACSCISSVCFIMPSQSREVTPYPSVLSGAHAVKSAVLT